MLLRNTTYNREFAIFQTKADTLKFLVQVGDRGFPRGPIALAWISISNIVQRVGIRKRLKRDEKYVPLYFAPLELDRLVSSANRLLYLINVCDRPVG